MLMRYWILAILLCLGACSDSSQAPLSANTDVAQGIPDTAASDTTLSDTTDPTDVSTACEGQGCPGDVCADDKGCKEGQCIWHQGERVCSSPCEPSCPDGMVCNSSLDYCESLAPMLCRPCVDNALCKDISGQGGTCVSYGDNGSFCGSKCTESKDCPAGYFCEDQQCKNGGGECECSQASIALNDSTQCSLSNDYGTCTGERVCDDTGLTVCSAQLPAEDVCDGLDNDCNGETDTQICDDGNPCTKDTCKGTVGCQFISSGDKPCDDGDLCTENDKCSLGDCLGTAVVCNDGDICTADTCEATTGCLFVDSQLCTCKEDDDCPIPKDRCLGIMKCIATEAEPFLHCEQDPATAVVCEVAPGPNAPCMVSECEPTTGLCNESSANEDGPCTLEDKCIAKSVCLQGECIVDEMVTCDDNNVCTTNTCDYDTGCVFTNNTLPCTDPDQCIEDGQCVDGLCKGDASCNDNNPCTSDACVEGKGCVYEPVTGPCAINDPCVVSAICSEGQCVVDEAKLCNDAVECTTDTCEAGVGCKFVPQSPDCCEFGEKDDASCYPPLVANAGPDVTIEKGESVQLMATAEGGDGQYTFFWNLPGAIKVDGAQATVSPTAPTTYTLVVTDGVGNFAIDKVTVLVNGVPLSLCDWPVVSFSPENHTQPQASWEFDEPCTTATQSVNAQPSILLSTMDFEEGTLTGAFHVDTKVDDDLIGFVFGYKSPTDFFVFDWKQKSQTFCGASSFEGVTLKRFKTNGEPLTCQDFFSSGGTPNSTIISPSKPPGWKENQAEAYQWTLSIKDSVATITIDQGDTQLHKVVATLPDFTGGLFGFYNNSQDSVVYEVFKFVDPTP